MSTSTLRTRTCIYPTLLQEYKIYWIPYTKQNTKYITIKEASSESNKKVKWYSDHHNNLMDDIRLAEEKASTKRDHYRKADEKLAQANLRITELDAKLAGLQKELTVLQNQDKRTPINWGNSLISLIQNQRPLPADPAGKGRRARPSPPPSATGASSPTKLVHWYQ